MTANNKQIGGNHYKSSMECWDYIVANDLGYLEGTAIKYITRWRKKNGIEDIKKAIHFLEKLVELNTPVSNPAAIFTGIETQFNGVGFEPVDFRSSERFHDPLATFKQPRNSDYPGGVEALEEWTKKVATTKALNDYHTGASEGSS